MSYITLALYVSLFLEKETSYLGSKLSGLDLVYASLFSGLTPRYLSIMALGIAGQLVLGPPRFFSLPLLILASVIEELYFRVKLYDELKISGGWRRAYIITLLLYSLFHISFISLLKLLPLLPIFLLLGALFQELRLKWGLASSIIAHIAYNILGAFYLVSFTSLSIAIISLSLAVTLSLVKFLA